MKYEDYSNLELSLVSFLSKQELKKPKHEQHKEYNLIFIGDDDKEYNVTIKVDGKKAIMQTKDIHELIRERLNKRYEQEITQEEKGALYSDAVIAYEFMRENFIRQDYQDSIRCAFRLEQDLNLIKELCLLEEETRIERKIEFTDLFRQRAHWAWENPANKATLIHLDIAEKEGNTPKEKKLQEEYTIYQPPDRGY